MRTMVFWGAAEQFSDFSNKIYVIPPVGILINFLLALRDLPSPSEITKFGSPLHKTLRHT